MHCVSFREPSLLFGICETWARSEKEFSNFLSSHKSFACFNERRKGSASYDFSIRVIGDSNYVDCLFPFCKNAIFLRICKEAFNTFVIRDIVLCCAYLPPKGSTSYTGEANGIEIIESYLIDLFSQLTNFDLILMGDLNARIGDLQDFIVENENNSVLALEYDMDRFCVHRNSRDKQVNAFGRSLIN